MKHLLLFPLLSGCAAIANLTGAGANMVQMAQVADYAKTSGDVVSYLETGRSLVDNAVSQAIGKDCQMTRLLDGEYCMDEPQGD